MNIRQMMEKYLVGVGCDGLVNPGRECGCRVGDLMPCDEPDVTECQPGYIGPPPPEEKATGCDWWMYMDRMDRANAVEAFGPLSADSGKENES